MKTFLCFRALQALLASNQDEAWEVLEDPTEEIIAGHINEVVENDTDFVCLQISLTNSTDRVNKDRGKVLEEFIDEELEVQITVVKSLGVDEANTLKKPA